MCELLGISCNMETTPKFSFSKLIKQERMQDGWGIAFNNQYEFNSIHANPRGHPYFTIIKYPSIPSKSKLAKEVMKLKSLHGKIFIAHVRRSSSSALCPLNTHPFELSLNPNPEDPLDKSWVFAHNGSACSGDFTNNLQTLKPHGNTDSEAIFCWLIENMRKQYPYDRQNPQRFFDELYKLLQTQPFLKHQQKINLIMSDGQHLFAYYGGYDRCGGLHYLLRRHGAIKIGKDEPGIEVDLEKNPGEQVAVVSTFERPETVYDSEPGWIRFNTNQLLIFKEGSLIFSRPG